MSTRSGQVIIANMRQKTRVDTKQNSHSIEANIHLLVHHMLFNSLKVVDNVSWKQAELSRGNLVNWLSRSITSLCYLQPLGIIIKLETSQPDFY